MNIQNWSPPYTATDIKLGNHQILVTGGGLKSKQEKYVFLDLPKLLPWKMFIQTCKKREIQHKRIFPPQKLAQKTRKSANIEIRDKTA